MAWSCLPSWAAAGAGAVPERARAEIRQDPGDTRGRPGSGGATSTGGAAGGGATGGGSSGGPDRRERPAGSPGRADPRRRRNVERRHDRLGWSRRGRRGCRRRRQWCFRGRRTGGLRRIVSGSTGARLVQNFNQAWKFKRADVTGAEATTFDDASWDDVGLPHSFNLPYFMASKFYVGYGWYRKHFAVPASWTGKSVALEFQAAFDQAEIYVNGTKAGEHLGGYNGFSIDVTSAIKTGDNVVAVRLNNRWSAELAAHR